MQVEVSRHEPLLALDGGEGDGIQELLRISNGAAHMLAPGGFLALETGGGRFEYPQLALHSNTDGSVCRYQSYEGA